MPNAACQFLLALALATLPAAVPAQPVDSRDIAVSVVRRGEMIDVDVEFLVAATPLEVWSVLTDYDHMAEFVSNVSMSRILRQADEKVEVAQTSRLGIGPFEFKFDNVREIELVPLREIRSTVVRGDMASSAFTTRLTPEGGVTRLTNRGRFLPGRWIPPIIATAVLESELRKQFGEYRAEILRRKALAAATAR